LAVDSTLASASASAIPVWLAESRFGSGYNGPSMEAESSQVGSFHGTYYRTGDI
jgi:hypothetical protein